MKLVLVSSNEHKASEIRNILSGVELFSLNDIGFHGTIEETGNSFAENASIKSMAIERKYKMNCLADDSGMEVDALHGAPGVYSARYAGEPSNDAVNNLLLLKEMKGKQNRSARFVSVISLRINEKENLFRGELKGILLNELRGQNGFGYDALFVPAGEQRTLAEMTFEEKNAISHRFQALKQVKEFLDKL